MTKAQFRKICKAATEATLAEMREARQCGAKHIPENPTTWDINNGFCDEWTTHVEKMVPEAAGMQTPDEDFDNGMPGHVWVKWKDKYYDAECLDGVKSWRELPCFSSNKGKSREQVIEERGG